MLDGAWEFYITTWTRIPGRLSSFVFRLSSSHRHINALVLSRHARLQPPPRVPIDFDRQWFRLDLDGLQEASLQVGLTEGGQPKIPACDACGGGFDSIRASECSTLRLGFPFDGCLFCRLSLRGPSTLLRSLACHPRTLECPWEGSRFLGPFQRPKARGYSDLFLPSLGKHMAVLGDLYVAIVIAMADQR